MCSTLNSRLSLQARHPERRIQSNPRGPGLPRWGLEAGPKAWSRRSDVPDVADGRVSCATPSGRPSATVHRATPSAHCSVCAALCALFCVRRTTQGSSRPFSTRAAGSRTVKQEPSSFAVSTSTLPSICWRAFQVTARPSPVPSYSRARPSDS